MRLPTVLLKEVITPLQSLVDRLIRESLRRYDDAGCRCMFWVPIHTLVPQAKRKRDLRPEAKRRAVADGHLYGKIPLLLVDPLDFEPIGAVLIDDPVERSVIEAVARLLDEAGLPHTIVTVSDYEQRVLELLDECFRMPRRRPSLGPALNLIERNLFNAFLKRLGPLADHMRVLAQVAISAVIEIPDLASRDDNRKFLRVRQVSTHADFVALRQKELGPQKQQAVLHDFCATSSFDLVFIAEESSSMQLEMARQDKHDTAPQRPIWWPVLAVEIDGEHHTGPEQQFRDFKKDLVAAFAHLPLLRIRLCDLSPSRGLSRQAQAEAALDDPRYPRPEMDFIRFMVAKLHGSYWQQQKAAGQLKRTWAVMERCKALTDAGLERSEAWSQAVCEDRDAHEAEDSGVWVDQMLEDEQLERCLAELAADYRERFGRPPELTVQISPAGELSGRLDDIELPPMKAFCAAINIAAMEQLQLEFGRRWLLGQALTDSN